MNPEGHLLFYTNTDKPGMLARVGTVLAEASINIAGLSLGRFGVGGKALTVMSIDSGISEQVLAKISSLEGVYEAKVVSL